MEVTSGRMNDESDDYGRSPWSGVEMMEESKWNYGNDVDNEEVYGRRSCWSRGRSMGLSVCQEIIMGTGEIM